jgi:hypothetical protein
MNPALSPDALYAKSQLYIRRGFRAKGEGDFEEYQLWASLALELLGKAVLANVHPSLVADPQHYESLFAACGKEISPDVRTITAKTLFSRLGHIDKAFDARHQKFCEQVSLRRNAELHSGESPFSGMKPELWEREYWGGVVVLLEMQDENLEAWLGADDAKAPAEIVEKANDARKWAVADRIKRAGEDFVKTHKDQKQREKIIAQADNFRWWEQRGKVHLSADGEQRQKCPSCGANALLLGALFHEEVLDDGPDEMSYVEVVEKHFSVEEFYCPACGLHLFGTDEIAAAELPSEFTETVDREREFEEDYGND